MDQEFIILRTRQIMKNTFTLNSKPFMLIRHSLFLISLISELSLNSPLLFLKNGFQLEMEQLEKNEFEDKKTLILLFLELLTEKILPIAIQKRMVVK